LPVLLVVAVAVKMDSKGPVFFRQKRVGINGGLFEIFKFRSMTTESDPYAVNPTQGNDARVTRVGRFLRKSSLDELPQLWSILKGDMSFVGPRPALFNQDDLVAMRTERGVHELVPGLTGWAQVNGLRGNTSINERVKYDLYYLENWSLSFDFKIILRTLLAHENAY